MCNCMNEAIEKFRKQEDTKAWKRRQIFCLGSVSGICGKGKGKKRERKMPVLLSRCPFCGELYDEKQMKAID